MTSDIKNKEKISHYLFDMDGTITSKNIYRTIYPILVEYLLKTKKISQKEFEIKVTKKGIIRHASGRWDSYDVSCCFNEKEHYYYILKEELKKQNILRKNVKEIFKKLKKEEKTIAIVSNSANRTINIYLEKYDLKKYIDFIVTQYDIGYKKSDLIFWKKLCKQKNLKPDKCIMIGDEFENDIKNPKKMGFNTLLITEEKDLKGLF